MNPVKDDVIQPPGKYENNKDLVRLCQKPLIWKINDNFDGLIEGVYVKIAYFYGHARILR